MNRRLAPLLTACLLPVLLVMGAITMPSAAEPDASPASSATDTVAVDVYIDASRSTAPDANARDRLAFIVDSLLVPRAAVSVHQLTHAVTTLPAPSLTDITFESRRSDYLALFEHLSTLPTDTPRLVLVIGDGRVEVVSRDMPQAYRDLAATERPTREDINTAVAHAVRERHAATAQRADLHPVLLSTASSPDRADLWNWWVSDNVRPELAERRLPANNLHLSQLMMILHQAGLPLPGGVREGVIVGSGTQRLAIDEGTEQVELLVMTPGGDPAFRLRVRDATGQGLPTEAPDDGPWLDVDDGVGVARRYVIRGVSWGANLTLAIDGASQPYQFLTIADTQLRHRMTPVAAPGSPTFYAGDTIALSHSLTHRDATTPVSDQLGVSLRATMRLEVIDANGETVAASGTSTALRLPPGPGTYTITAQFPDAVARIIDTQPITITIEPLEPLSFAGGFTATEVAHGSDDASVALVQFGGRAVVPSVRVHGSAPSGAARTLPLAATAEPVPAPARGAFALGGPLPFTAEDLGTWTIESVHAGTRTVEDLRASEGHSLTLEVVSPELSGGFSSDAIHPGNEDFDVVVTVANGPLRYESITVHLEAEDGRTRDVVLARAEDGSYQGLAEDDAFTDDDVGEWTIAHATVDTETNVPVSADDPRGTTVSITRDLLWLWLLLAGLAVLLLLVIVIIIATLPRWGDECLVGAHGVTAIKDRLGPKRRNTAWGLSDLEHRLLWRKTRKGVVILPQREGQLFINGQPTPFEVNQALPVLPGNDIEWVRKSDGKRIHARFFDSREAADRAGPDAAQIDLEAFASPHIIIEV